MRLLNAMGRAAAATCFITTVTLASAAVPYVLINGSTYEEGIWGYDVAGHSQSPQKLAHPASATCQRDHHPRCSSWQQRRRGDVVESASQ